MNNKARQRVKCNVKLSHYKQGFEMLWILASIPINNKAKLLNLEYEGSIFTQPPPSRVQKQNDSFVWWAGLRGGAIGAH